MATQVNVYQITEQERQALISQLGEIPYKWSAQALQFLGGLKPHVEKKKERSA